MLKSPSNLNLVINANNCMFMFFSGGLELLESFFFKESKDLINSSTKEQVYLTTKSGLENKETNE